MESEVAIVGAGVLGAKTTYWLSKLYDYSVAVLEKGNDIALHTTMRNRAGPQALIPRLRAEEAPPRSAEKSYHRWKPMAVRFGLPWNEVEALAAVCDREVATLELNGKRGAEMLLDSTRMKWLMRWRRQPRQPMRHGQGSRMLLSEGCQQE